MKKALNFRTILVCVLVLVMCVACFVACDKTKNQYDETSLNNAKNYLRTIYEDLGPTTPSNFDVIVKAPGKNGVMHDVEWTVAVSTEGQEASVSVVPGTDKVTIQVPEKATEDISYTLTATIKDGEHNLTLVFNLTVPKWRELTWAEYMAKAANEAVIVKGKVASISSKSTGDKYNCMYIYDEDGGYYIYSLTEDPLTTYPDLKIGMTVQVTGTKDIYNGTHEVKNATFTVLDATSTIDFADITEVFAATTDMKAEALTNKAYMPVVIKNVIIGDIDTASSYYYFSIGASKSYLRVSSSDNMLSADETQAFKDGFAALNGKYATVKGMATVYNGAFYIQVITTDAAVEQEAPAKDPAGQIEDVKGRLAIDTTISGSGRTFNLPTQDTVYTDVKIAWTASSEVAAIADGKVTYTFIEDGTVTLTATLTHATDATVSDTKTFEVSLSVGTAVTVAEFLEKKTGSDVYVLTGYIVADAEDSKAGSFVFADATGAVFSYNKFDVAVGDKVKIIATRTVNSGVPQLGTISVEKLDKAEGEQYTYPEAVELKAEDINLANLSATSIVDMTGKLYKITGTILYKNGDYVSAGTVGATAGSYNQLISVYAPASVAQESMLGKEVDIYGYVRGFSTGKYLTIQTVKIAEKEKTDAEKLALAKDELTSVTGDGSVAFSDSFTLVTEGAYGTTIAWRIKEEGVTALTIDGATATVTKPETDVALTLVATISLAGSEEAAVEKEFPITITATIPTYTVTITPVTGATITVMNGAEAVVSGTTLNKGTELVITVVVDDQHKLVSVNNGETTLTAETDGSYKLTLVADANITAVLSDYPNLTIAQFKALAVGAEAKVTAIVTNIDSKATWLQDAEGNSLYVYATGIEGVEVGKQVTLGGKRGEFNGLVQLTKPVLVGTATDPETAITATTLDETKYKALVANDAAKLVNINGLVYVSGTATNTSGGNLKFTLGATTVTVRVEKGDADALNTVLSNLTAGVTINIKNANIGWYNAPQVAISRADQIEVVWNVSADIDKTEILVGETAQITAAINPNFMAATVGDITYEALDPTIATVSETGLITGIATGTASFKAIAGDKFATVSINVTATVTKYTVSWTVGENGTLTSAMAGETALTSGDEVEVDTVVTFVVAPADGYRLASVTIGEGTADTSFAGQTTFDVTVTANTTVAIAFETIPVVKEFTISFANADARESLDANSQVWKSGDLVFTNSKGSSTSPVADYTNPVRLYKKSTVKIELANITKIEFNVNTGKPIANLQNSLKDKGTVTVAGSTLTIEFETPQSVLEFVCAEQIRLNSLTVYTA